MKKNTYCVIMAGGVGSRFWPMSTSERPKQFIDILGTGRSLLQQTFDRLTKVCPKENVLIVTNADYGNLVLEQLPQLTRDQVLLEPMRRNTAPCIAYANYKILEKNKNAKIIVAPSDHLILKEEEFLTEIKKALDFADKNDALLTLGIKPSRPETGYGYIQINKEAKASEYSNQFKVKTFTEKPNLELAKVFLESGDFFWNSGIFVWSLSSINKAFEQYLPEISAFFKEGIGKYYTSQEQSFINSIYSECKNISIDYGVMEKADNVYVLCSDFGWSDLGTWGSLYENLDKDENNNTIQGKNTLVYNTRGCIVNVPNEKLVAIQGLEDFIVVDSDNTLLICKKEEEQNIRQIVNDIKITRGEKYV